MDEKFARVRPRGSRASSTLETTQPPSTVTSLCSVSTATTRSQLDIDTIPSSELAMPLGERYVPTGLIGVPAA